MVKLVPDIIFDDEADIPIIERHKQDARRDANAAPKPPDNDQHLADEPTFILLENPNAEPYVKGRPKTPNPEEGDEWVFPPNNHPRIAKGELTKPLATENTYDKTTDVNATKGISLTYLDVANKVIDNNAKLGIIRRPNGTLIWR